MWTGGCRRLSEEVRLPLAIRSEEGLPPCASSSQLFVSSCSYQVCALPQLRSARSFHSAVMEPLSV